MNAHGGINGHQVKFVFLDDQGSESIALQDAQELVQQDHVMAVVGTASEAVAGYASYLRSQNVPWIGSVQSGPPSSDDLFFPVGTTYEYLPDGAPYLAAHFAHAKKFGFLYCSEVPVCAQAVPLVRTQSQLDGMDLSYVSAAPLDSASYTSYCLAAKSAGVASLLPEFDATSIVTLAQNCQAQGYKPILSIDGAPVGPITAAAPALNGTLATEAVFPWTANYTPAQKAFHSAIHTYEPKESSAPGYTAITAGAWVDAEMFEAAAKVMKGTSSSSLTAALGTLKNETLGGLISPQSYSVGREQVVAVCFSGLQLTNGKWVAIEKGKFFCAPHAGK